jgi:hypothetical protein
MKIKEKTMKDLEKLELAELHFVPAAASCKWIKESFFSVWHHITLIPGGPASEGYTESFVEIIRDL